MYLPTLAPLSGDWCEAKMRTPGVQGENGGHLERDRPAGEHAENRTEGGTLSSIWGETAHSEVKGRWQHQEALWDS